jgi:hypothetical protein
MTTEGSNASLATNILAEGGRTYELKYSLSNSNVGRNYWETRIETTDGPSSTTVVDQTSDIGQLPMTPRSFNVSLPSGSTHFDLTFAGGGVRIGHLHISVDVLLT